MAAVFPFSLTPMKFNITSVGSALRKFLAVTAVGTFFLSVGLTGCKRETPARTETQEQTDEKISDQVRAAFGNSPSFKFPDVQVASFKGRVQLSGFVVSDDQKSSAEAIAKGVSGVVEVENKISLKQ